MRRAVEAVAGLGPKVLCTVGEGRDPAVMLPDIAGHVTVERYVPQSMVLPHCGLVVCHGGYSTVMGAMCAGLPMVIIPIASDHHANAAQCARLGVAVTVDSQASSVSAVRSAVDRILSEPCFAAAAQALARRAAEAAPVQFGARLLGRIPSLYSAGIDVVGRPLPH